MKIFYTLDDHFKYLNDLLVLPNKPQAAFISSFGLYAGISHTGQDTTLINEKYRSQTRDFLERLRGIHTRIIIGVSEYKSCKGKYVPCYDCEKNYIYQVIRLLNHAELFGEFQWKVASQLHSKCTLLAYDENGNIKLEGVAGGRNLNDSGWADITFQLDHVSAVSLYKYMAKLYQSSMDLTEKNVKVILKDQGISEKSIGKMIKECEVFGE